MKGAFNSRLPVGPPWRNGFLCSTSSFTLTVRREKRPYGCSRILSRLPISSIFSYPETSSTTTHLPNTTNKRNHHPLLLLLHKHTPSLTSKHSYLLLSVFFLLLSMWVHCFSKFQCLFLIEFSGNMSRCMWIETLPSAMQSKILSFLTIEHLRFHESDLRTLATNMLKQPNLDFWVMKSAKNLLNAITQVGFLDTHLDMGDEFSSLPEWLKGWNEENSVILPWLPLSQQSISRTASEQVSRSMREVCALKVEEMNEVMDDNVRIEDGLLEPVHGDPNLESSIQSRALTLKEQLLGFDEHGDANKASKLADEIRKLCGLGHTATILGLIEPWKADEETTLCLLTHLSGENESGDCEWLSQILCSFLLPVYWC